MLKSEEELSGYFVFKPMDRVVDQTNAASFLQPAREQLGAGRDIVLDLSELRFLNSAGLGSIVTLVRDAGASGLRIRVCGAQPTVQALFDMVHLSNIVPVDTDLGASLAALAHPGG